MEQKNARLVTQAFKCVLRGGCAHTENMKRPRSRLVHRPDVAAAELRGGGISWACVLESMGYLGARRLVLDGCDVTLEDDEPRYARSSAEILELEVRGPSMQHVACRVLGQLSGSKLEKLVIDFPVVPMALATARLNVHLPHLRTFELRDGSMTLRDLAILLDVAPGLECITLKDFSDYDHEPHVSLPSTSPPLRQLTFTLGLLDVFVMRNVEKIHERIRPVQRVVIEPPSKDGDNSVHVMLAEPPHVDALYRWLTGASPVPLHIAPCTLAFMVLVMGFPACDSHIIRMAPFVRALCTHANWVRTVEFASLGEARMVSARAMSTLLHALPSHVREVSPFVPPPDEEADLSDAAIACGLVLV